MALIECSECGKQVSDKAQSCPNCGAPVTQTVASESAPTTVSYIPSDDTFIGTQSALMKLAMKAIKEHGWKLTDANESLGFLNFETKISWGSWSGVAGTIMFEEVSPNTFRLSGEGKQNIRGGQLIAFNIGNEAQNKAKKAIETMKLLARKS